MDRRLKITIGFTVLVIAAYLGYRWWQNRGSNSQGLGSNLGSVGSLAGGSTGPDSGLSYTAGSVTVQLEQPVTDSGGGSGLIIPGEPPPLPVSTGGTGSPPPGPRRAPKLPLPKQGNKPGPNKPGTRNPGVRRAA